MVHEAELAEKSINVDGDEKKDDEAYETWFSSLIFNLELKKEKWLHETFKCCRLEWRKSRSIIQGSISQDKGKSLSTALRYSYNT